MGSGLKSRKKNSNQDDSFDPEAQKGGDSDKVKKYGRVGSLKRFVQSEVGCAIEIVIGFLIFALLLAYFISHHRQRKVRLCVVFERAKLSEDQFAGTLVLNRMHAISINDVLTIFLLLRFLLSGCLSYYA